MSRPSAVFLLFLAACQSGTITSPPQPPPPPPPSDGGETAMACDAPHVDASPLRRLRRLELENTLHDLFTLTGSYTDTFPDDEVALGFDDQAAAMSVSQLYVEQLMTAAERVSNDVDILALSSCTTRMFAACATTLITGTGARAFRRPLTADEISTYQALYTDVAASDGPEQGLRVTLQALLESPAFLYRLELKADAETPGQVVALDGYELATRLSYFLWASTPDATLLAAAQNAELSTPVEVEAQARRMLADPRAQAMVDDYFNQWLDLSTLQFTFKEDPLFGRVKPTLALESAKLASDIYWNGHADDLLTASYTFGTGAQALLYGVPAPTGGGYQRIMLDPTQRPGLLTRVAFLAINAKPAESSPLHRGKFVREKLLCFQMPPPPANVPPLPPLMPGQTTREHFAAHTQNPACSGCHSMMDPIGFGLERYDELGRYRTTQAGQPIDDTGTLANAGDQSGDFSGPSELMAKLTASSDVKTCLVQQSFRYGMGRAETSADDCSRQAVLQRFSSSGFDLKELTLGLTLSDAFRYRISPQD